MSPRLPLPLVLLLASMSLSACSDDSAPAQVQPMPLEQREGRGETASPAADATTALWQVADHGQALHFGQAGAPPLLSLACDIDAAPPALTIIRHARALPGQGALLPVIGNAMSSRFLVDAALEEGEWRWQATLPAADPQWDVFAGPRDLTATLPGHGMLEIAGSRVPGEFLAWCRAGGEVPAG